MATVYGVNRTLLRAGSVNTIEPELVGAKVKWVYDSYEAAALAGASVIELGGIDIPVGARIVDWVIDHDALGDAMPKLSFGTKEDANEFMDLVDCFAADKKNMTDDGVAAALGFKVVKGTAAASGQTLIITTSGSSTATGTIKVAVAYVAKG